MRTVRPALHGLVDAMDAAEHDHRPIPCKDGDRRWWSDLLTHNDVRQLRDQCRSRCPALAECNEMRIEARGLRLPITHEWKTRNGRSHYCTGNRFPFDRPHKRHRCECGSWRPDSDTQVRDAALLLWGAHPALVFGSWRSPRPAITRQRLLWWKRNTNPGLGTGTPWSPRARAAWPRRLGTRHRSQSA